MEPTEQADRRPLASPPSNTLTFIPGKLRFKKTPEDDVRRGAA